MAVDAAVIEARPAAPERHRGPVRRVSGVIGTIFSVVVVMVGVLALVLAIATHFAPTNFTAFGHPLLVVVSGSMTPAIDTGDVIIESQVTRDQAAHLQAGQIISFHQATGGATTITHRIHAVTTVGGAVAYITKGDANNAPDATPVTPAQIVGVYDAKIPAAGYVMNALKQPLTLGLLLAAPALWLLSGLLFAWARELEEAGKETPAERDSAHGERR